MSTVTGVRTLLETTRTGAPDDRREVRVARPADRRDARRPGRGREVLDLPPVRRGPVGGRSCADARGHVRVPASAVVLRRRRVAVAAALVVVLAVALAAGLALLTPAPGARAGTVPVGERVAVAVVGEGESLSDLADRAVPGADVDAATDRIRTLNGLRGSALTPGRPLLVPTP